MDAHQLTITYAAGSGKAAPQFLHLVQVPVSTVRLTAEDLHIMLAMVKAGVSAKAYKPKSCEAYVVGDMAYCDLQVYLWPSSMALNYTLTAQLLTLSAPQVAAVEREFDLVVEMSESVELPCIATDLTATWQTPCYNRVGVRVDPPAITIKPTSLQLGAEVFGVLRIRCLAHGWIYPLQFSMRKDALATITDIKPTLTATWGPVDNQQSTSIDIQLPACLEALLAACDDGDSYRDKAFGKVDKDEELVPTIYYTPCSGRMLQVRNERP